MVNINRLPIPHIDNGQHLQYLISGIDNGQHSQITHPWYKQWSTLFYRFPIHFIDNGHHFQIAHLPFGTPASSDIQTPLLIPLSLYLC